ncbi:exotoxin [Serratia sp. PAMC26656]|uniref:MrpH family fimbial adhesin n=1 Tax=Serratia sp. PAMC26656 TaxID=2775909 RepID=UPI0018F72758|nr:exotoxin [Serratia sp. PAMC26656]MBJ7892093.1 exotoxin [Serratia sp. PAMC26656]
MNYIKKYVIVIISILFIYTSTVQASIFMQVTKRTGSFAFGTFYYELLDWTTDDNTPNPCYRNSKCEILLTSNHNTIGIPSDTGGYWSANGNSWVSNSATMGILGQNFKQFVGIPRSGSFTYSNILGGSSCVGMFYRTGGILGTNITRLPGSICAIPPEEKNACEIKTPQLTLDHGVLAPEQLNNNTATGSLLLSCNQTTKIQLYISENTGGVILRSDGSLFSNLTLNGQPASKGIALQVGPTGTTVQVSSVLRAVGNVEAGVFQGSAVALLSLP